MNYLDIINEDDEIIGREERNTVHEKHLLHRSIHIIVVNNKNQILLQLRKASKKQYPLFWSGSTAGHIDSGENVTKCAIREIFEEIGLKTKLTFVDKFIINDAVEHELVNVFFTRSDGPFKIDFGEVEKVEWFDIETLRKNNSMKMTPHCRKAIDLVIKKYF
ncbi:MAG: NUDIX domain-containing protein [Nanoarchaeota archaeon]|nr:NUDIX domain-containing protein [Nanoarchaeota archaeon]MBU1269947.1 NUDIX domain-containing protein [Nanoarchaeota archaeon]MBU1604038.1 NUDIX domain-containing protein [Nanoarchaeota archaeon]MBU2442477.1 NUDIX domain-containing protein [Nanoarchaeota archaeon]